MQVDVVVEGDTEDDRCDCRFFGHEYLRKLLGPRLASDRSPKNSIRASDDRFLKGGAEEHSEEDVIDIHGAGGRGRAFQRGCADGVDIAGLREVREPLRRGTLV
jgi:hypothetical protein